METTQHSRDRKRDAARFLFCLLTIWLTACGFQLNRNQPKLLNSAGSLSLESIENKSFEPRLDLDLRAFLDDILAEHSIRQVTSSAADLLVSVDIVSYSVTKSDYALDDTQLIYEFRFTARGHLTAYTQRDRQYLLRNSPIAASSSIKSQLPDLTSALREEGKSEVLEAFSNAVFTRLTQEF